MPSGFVAAVVICSLLGLGAARCSDAPKSTPKSAAPSSATAEEEPDGATTASGDETSKGEPNEGQEQAAPTRIPTGHLTGSELRWLRDYARWRDRRLARLGDVWSIRERWKYHLLDRDYENRPIERYRRALPAAGRCGDSLGRHVGRPGARFREAFDLLREGCQAVERAAASDVEALRTRDADQLLASEGDWAAGFLAAEQAAEAVLARLTKNRDLPVVRGRSSRSRIVPRYSIAATDLVFFEQQVRCWSNRDWKAILREERAYWNGVPTSDIVGLFGAKDRVHLAPEICKGLDVFAHSRRRPKSGTALLEVALAVETLAHEAEHRRGSANEAITECRAAQRTRKAARLLGASRRYSALLAETFWAEVYPYKPAAYRAASCRDGGRLDLRPRSSVWP
jgi:hypothetical protein